jgi:hypothetical protein
MSVVSPENICTCKDCSHDYVRDCDSCKCCTPDSHSMLLDGIEGFGAKRKEEPVHVPVVPLDIIQQSGPYAVLRLLTVSLPTVGLTRKA